MANKEKLRFMARYSAFSPYRLRDRESGFGTPIGSGDALARSLYCGMKPIASWDCEQANAHPTGGVFNLEFSPEGTLLVAACEKKSIQVFDPLTHQRIHSMNGAHSDCVNCVKFLDGRMFATCSDDTTIALWDIRNMNKKIRSLAGHSSWVKNIEFSFKDKLLVTSELNGSIYTWDINSYTECNLVYQRVFHASGLMRCRLSPDARQMVMCTTGGLLVIIHNLNLSTLGQDLHGFKPNLYRLMQTSNQLIPIAAAFDHLFDDKREENRLEFVSDFPDGNDAKVVSSLQIHPLGWSALSRNISHDDRSEWSCIHDIQPTDESWKKSTRDSGAGPSDAGGGGGGGGGGAGRSRTWARRPSPRLPSPRRSLRRPRARPCRRPHTALASTSSQEPQPSTSERAPERAGGGAESPEPGPSRPRPEPGPSRPRPEPGADSPPAPSSRLAGLSSIQNDVWEASITIKQHRVLQELYSRGVGRNFNMQRIMGINTGISPPPASLQPRPLRTSVARILPHGARDTSPRHEPGSSTSPSTSGQTPLRDREFANSSDEDREARSYIRQNKDRLLYYIEETNEGKGFIKELCYSADGRLVCSPFGRGMRLLALNEDCSELSHCVQGLKGPTAMLDVGQSLGIHQDLVVSSKFNPRYHMLVTGCLEGKIVWYEPYSGEAMY